MFGKSVWRSHSFPPYEFPKFFPLESMNSIGKNMQNWINNLPSSQRLMRGMLGFSKEKRILIDGNEKMK